MIKRKLLKDLTEHLSSKEFSLIVGPRQAGKTTLMKELLHGLEARGAKTLFLNLDVESDRIHFSSQEALIRKVNLELGAAKGYVFIDEIQRKENAGLFLKGVYDSDLRHKFIVSGSGSLELKEKLHESLAGRKRLFELRTVSLEEFIDYRTSYRYEGRLREFFSVEKEKAQALLSEYLVFGGYPRVVTESDSREKRMLMDEIYRSYIDKDIAALLKVDKTEAYSKLIRLLAAQVGTIQNVSRLATDSGVSIPTLNKYLWYAEKTFIVNQVPPFFTNKTKEITKSPVIYFTDAGMRNYALGLFGTVSNPNELGLVFQNLIHNILRERYRFQPASIHHWRTIDKAEVDFVARVGNTIIPVEVKYSQLKKPTLTRSFRSFLDKYNPDRAFVVSPDYETQIDVGSTTVQFVTPAHFMRPIEDHP